MVWDVRGLRAMTRVVIVRGICGVSGAGGVGID